MKLTRKDIAGQNREVCSGNCCHGSRDEKDRDSGIILRQMQKGESGTITAVRAKGELGQRIREIGLIPGTQITVEKRAPLYDPVALRVMGCIITLRNNEADNIEVRLD
ncbi:MAG: ferrous iron transport protein A [Desulfurivibrionaceae bacterium]